MRDKNRVVHIISNLGDGGAEGALCRLILNDNSGCKHEVISVMGGGKHSKTLKECNIKVVELDIKPGSIGFLALFKMYKQLSIVKPDVVQTWMYHADLIGGIISKIAKIDCIVWNIRTSFLTGKNIKFSTKMIIKACSLLSNIIPNKIITCSNNAALFHKSIGYKNNFTTIDNGFDTDKLYPSKSIKLHARRELSICDNIFLIGMVARFDPQKDHKNIISALSYLSNLKVNFGCIFVGKGMDNDNIYIKNLINSFNLTSVVLLKGQNSDIGKIMNAIDLHVLSSSYGEAFPNVVAEAMLCGTPCVVTDVGDSARIVGDTGWVVEPNNANSLSFSIKNAIDLKLNNEEEWNSMCKNAASKAKSEYSIKDMVLEYHKVWFC